MREQGSANHPKVLCVQEDNANACYLPGVGGDSSVSLEVALGSLKGKYCANGSIEIYGIFGGRQTGLRQAGLRQAGLRTVCSESCCLGEDIVLRLWL